MTLIYQRRSDSPANGAEERDEKLTELHRLGSSHDIPAKKRSKLDL